MARYRETSKASLDSVGPRETEWPKRVALTCVFLLPSLIREVVPLSSCGGSGEFLDLSKPQFSYLQNGDSNAV